MTPAPPAHVSPQDKKLQMKIAELQGKEYLPEQLVTLAAEVSRLQYKALARIAASGDKESAGKEALRRVSPRDKRYSGVPILPGKEFPLDMLRVKELADALLATLPRTLPMLGAYASELTARLEEPGFLEAVCREVLDPSLAGKDTPHCEAWAGAHPETPHFLRFIVTSAVKPSLIIVGEILGAEHDAKKVWPHGHCPVCGNHPLIGRLADKEGRRMHSCSFCGFEYRAPRLGCPFCLASEGEGTEYLVSEDEPGYLLSVCKACNSYFKLSDFRELDRPWIPPLDDLSSLALDFVAASEGYKRPTLSGWGF